MRAAIRSILAALVLAFASTARAQLYGVDYDSGALYAISTQNAALTLVGQTHVQLLGSLEFAPDGRLFGIRVGSSPALYQINPYTAAATLIAPLNIGFAFEGGLAFSPNGTAYAVNSGSSAAAGLFTLDLVSGQTTMIGTISGGSHDINGLGWRADGQLVGLDRVSNSLLTIDPSTAVSALIKQLTPTVGGVGGMDIVGNAGYFNTSGPAGSTPGSNELYSFNPFSGDYQLIGSFSPTITGQGISGLAFMVPEPSAATFWILGASFLAFYRKRSALGSQHR
jgi:hypothetical protein